jgi:hypothetical protein
LVSEYHPGTSGATSSCGVPPITPPILEPSDDIELMDDLADFVSSGDNFNGITCTCTGFVTLADFRGAEPVIGTVAGMI